MLLQVILLTCFSNHVNSQFIIDMKSPIVIHDDRGGAGSNFFGYSLAFIKGQFGSASYHQSSPFHGTLFIGAPKETQVTIRNMGIVWGCNFNKNASVNCSPLNKVSNMNPVSKPSCTRQKALSYPETENDQWIGSSLTTTNQHLYACAPRWKLNGFEYSSNGHCRDFTAIAGACYKATSAERPTTVIGPFYKADTSISNWYQYAQFGFSSHATRSGNLVFGTPSTTPIGFTGYWDCRGTYMEYVTGSGQRFIRNRDPECYSYLGYSITTGRTRDRREYVAVGAPRGKSFFGSVLINYFGSSSPKLWVVGEQFGAYFGYSIATADLIGDGVDKLIVGAPMFTADSDNEHGFNGGCVFVYDVDLSSQTQKQLQKLCLDQQPKGARFGSAIANLGDINFDKKDDFAVAAPYYDDGVGTVFIYYGGLPSSTTPVQVIQGKSLGIPGLKGFGTFLLSGNVDVDGNGTPDLAISSFESNHVIVLRTRPVAIPTLKVTFHVTGSRGDAGKINKFRPTQSESGFRARICNNFEFSVAVPQNFPLECWITIEMDKRIELSAGSAGEKFRYNFSSIQETCIDVSLSVKPTFVDESSETPYQFRAALTYNANNTEPLVIPTIPISFSAKLETNSAFSQAVHSFKEYYPAPIPTTWSALEKLEVAEDNCDSDGNASCNPNLKLVVNFVYELRNGKNLSGNQPFPVGQVETLFLEIFLENSGETAYRPSVKVSLKIDDKFEIPQTVWQWRLKEPSGKIEEFQSTENSNSLIISQFGRQSRPLHNQTKNVYELRVSNWGNLRLKEKLTGELQVKIKAFPEEQETEEKVEWKHSIRLEAKLNIEIEAVAGQEGKSEIDPAKNRVDLSQIYTVKNKGPSCIGADQLKAEIFVPTHAYVNNSLTQVLGVINPSQYNSRLRCEAHDFSFYSLDSSPSILEPSITYRVSSEPLALQMKTETDKSYKLAAGSDNLVTLSGCSPNKPSLHCRRITCVTDLPSMQSRAIKIHMYLLPETLDVLISPESTGIKVDSYVSVTFLKTAVKRSEGTTTRKFLMRSGIPAWMIIVAVGGGIILFLLMTLALYKCGFFTRKVKKELQTLRRQTQMWMEFNNEEVPSPTNEEGENKTNSGRE